MLKREISIFALRRPAGLYVGDPVADHEVVVKSLAFWAFTAKDRFGATDGVAGAVKGMSLQSFIFATFKMRKKLSGISIFQAF